MLARPPPLPSNVLTVRAAAAWFVPSSPIVNSNNRVHLDGREPWGWCDCLNGASAYAIRQKIRKDKGYPEARCMDCIAGCLCGPCYVFQVGGCVFWCLATGEMGRPSGRYIFFLCTHSLITASSFPERQGERLGHHPVRVLAPVSLSPTARPPPCVSPRVSSYVPFNNTKKKKKKKATPPPPGPRGRSEQCLG